MTIPVSASQRLARVRSRMVKEGLNALVAFAPADCRYLTGFTGEAASVVVTGDDWQGATATARPADDVPGPTTTTTTTTTVPSATDDPSATTEPDAASTPPDAVEDPGSRAFFEARAPDPGADCPTTG